MFSDEAAFMHDSLAACDQFAGGADEWLRQSYIAARKWL